MALFSILAKFGQSCPRLDRAYRTAAALVTLAGLAAVGTGHYFAFAPFLQAAFLAMALLNLAGSAVLALRGGEDARIYLVSFGPYLLGGFLRLVTVLGWVPPGPVSGWALQVGTLAHLCLMHLPLAERQRRLQRDLHRAHAEALAPGHAQRARPGAPGREPDPGTPGKSRSGPPTRAGTGTADGGPAAGLPGHGLP